MNKIPIYFKKALVVFGVINLKEDLSLEKNFFAMSKIANRFVFFQHKIMPGCCEFLAMPPV